MLLLPDAIKTMRKELYPTNLTHIETEGIIKQILFWFASDESLPKKNR